jgi:zinc/manganese transport system substrate-binding protein
MTRPALVALALGSLALAGCGGAGAAASSSPTDEAAEGVRVVATTTILGSVVGDVAQCAGGTAETLMPVGADPHDFSPSAQQVATLVSADLVVANGLGLEEGLEDALAGAERDGATILEVAPQLDPIPFGGDAHAEEEAGQSDEEAAHSDDEAAPGEKDAAHTDEAGKDDGHGSLDPHVWQDVARMATAATLVGDQLAELTGDDAYASCGAQVRDELLDVDEQVRGVLESVPAQQRVLVTDHDSLGYLADAYGFEVVGTVIPGGSTLAEPSSAELAALAGTIQEQGVPAIFANTSSPTELVDAVAAETGTQVQVVGLYLDSLGPEGSGAETYTDMVTTNAERIADALQG